MGGRKLSSSKKWALGDIGEGVPPFKGVPFSYMKETPV